MQTIKAVVEAVITVAVIIKYNNFCNLMALTCPGVKWDFCCRTEQLKDLQLFTYDYRNQIV